LQHTQTNILAVSPTSPNKQTNKEEEEEKEEEEDRG